MPSKVIVWFVCLFAGFALVYALFVFRKTKNNTFTLNLACDISTLILSDSMLNNLGGLSQHSQLAFSFLGGGSDDIYRFIKNNHISCNTLVICVGINDYRRRINSLDYISKIINEIKSHSIILVGLFPISQQREKIMRVSNDILKKHNKLLISFYCQIPKISFYDPFENGFFLEDKQNTNFFSPDGLHLNSNGLNKIRSDLIQIIGDK
ncbi:MAG: hypothetical protein ABIM30_07770 [candidate division WOR-3 bacterium]